MPTYEYECLENGHRFEEFQSMTDPPLTECKICGGRVRRLIGSGAGVLFKGPGFYETDYRSESYRKAEKKDTEESSGEKKSSRDKGKGSKGKALAVIGLLLLSACGGRDWQEEMNAALGASAQGPEQLIKSLQEFLGEDPPVEYASEARFTIGFTFAESLRQYSEARRWFEELLEEDPEGAWAEEAEWMLENMEKDIEEILPELKGEVPPPS